MKSTAIAVLALATASAHASLLVNGGFEDPPTGAYGHFADEEVPGWSVTRGSVMEIGRYLAYGVTGAQGLNVLETDSDHNVSVWQSVDLSAGDVQLDFSFARRAYDMQYKPADTCDFDVLWNGVTVASISPSATAMSQRSLILKANEGTNTVTFRAMGTSDGYGALIDAVELNPVPEPATLAAMGIAGASLLSRRRRARQ